MLCMYFESNVHLVLSIAIKAINDSKVSILIVDRKYSLTAELNDDTKQTSIEAIGLATYSNSQSTVLSYVSIFESLWTQTDTMPKRISIRVHIPSKVIGTS